ncbi:hypothetical protein [Spirulina sp. 06S082]|uniref:HAD family hydrolase n=1 Tax=Spirulina sp. 06S082 TaxID=3110248 RepID=UPI002B21C926|nr:hypothetical protein [Spirulina sp. 06S082]MEA5467372.1 hypothetical protein [Spirulina sp. 06S082]
MKKVYSFDIFDTVLVRIWAKPCHLFWKLGQALKENNLLPISVDSWYELRKNTEQKVRQNSAREEITLKEIYGDLSLLLNWSKWDIEKAIALEIALEKKSLFLVPEIYNCIQQHRQEQAKIIYISDMYLPESTLKELLEIHKIWQKKDSLYVSSTYKSTKASGKLFTDCLHQESLQNRQLIHTGDNFYSDVQVAKKLGIQAHLFTKTNLNRYEDKIANHPQLSLEFRSILAGSSRLTRLSNFNLIFSQSVIWEIAASVIAPVLFGFVYWCLQSARDRGIERLYFIARDGQILLKIAQIICQNWGYSIDCRYLYGSRQSWHFPAIQEIGKYELEWLFDPTSFLSIESLCKRVHLEPDEIEVPLNKSGFPRFRWTDNLKVHERELLKSVFQTQEVTNIILKRALKFRENALGYFHQEGLANPVYFGIVDIGWNGRLQYSLSRLLNSGGIYPKEGISGFYFALSRRFKCFEKEQLFAYFSDVDCPHDRDRLCYYRELFELFVAADHGGTVCFENNRGIYYPVLRSQLNQQAIQWGLKTQQEAIIKFCQIFTQNLNKDSYSNELGLKSAELLLKEFIDHPNRLEADIFGSFQVSEDQNETKFHELAPKYTIIASLKRLILNRDSYHSIWFPAVQIRGSFIARILISPLFLKIRFFLVQLFVKLGKFLNQKNIK